MPLRFLCLIKVRRKAWKIGPTVIIPAWGTDRIAFFQQRQWHGTVCARWNCTGWNYSRWSWPWFYSLPGCSYWTCTKCKHRPYLLKRMPSLVGMHICEQKSGWKQLWIATLLKKTMQGHNRDQGLLIFFFPQFRYWFVFLLPCNPVRELGLCWKVMSDPQIRKSANKEASCSTAIIENLQRKVKNHSLAVSPKNG